MTRSPPLSFDDIHAIRTSSLSNADLARQFDRSEGSITLVRRGLSYRDHPTPPQVHVRKGAVALTFEAVHHIRTCGLPDRDLATLYGVTETCVIQARRGRTWPDHPTPPDRRLRKFGSLQYTGIDWATVPHQTEIVPVNLDVYDRLRARCRLDHDGCWIWTGGEESSLDRGNSDHHGHTHINGESIGAHRAMWIAVHGPIPEGMCVCHECDKPKCLRPKCLWLGTHADNMQDAARKGRMGRARKSSGEEMQP